MATGFGLTENLTSLPSSSPHRSLIQQLWVQYALQDRVGAKDSPQNVLKHFADLLPQAAHESLEADLSAKTSSKKVSQSVQNHALGVVATLFLTLGDFARYRLETNVVTPSFLHDWQEPLLYYSGALQLVTSGKAHNSIALVYTQVIDHFNAAFHFLCAEYNVDSFQAKSNLVLMLSRNKLAWEQFQTYTLQRPAFLEPAEVEAAVRDSLASRNTAKAESESQRIITEPISTAKDFLASLGLSATPVYSVTELTPMSSHTFFRTFLLSFSHLLFQIDLDGFPASLRLCIIQLEALLR